MSTLVEHVIALGPGGATTGWPSLREPFERLNLEPGAEVYQLHAHDYAAAIAIWKTPEAMDALIRSRGTLVYREPPLIALDERRAANG